MQRLSRSQSAPNDLRDEDRAADRQTESLAGLAAAILLVVLCLALIQHLRQSANLEDCLLAGRITCEVATAFEERN